MRCIKLDDIIKTLVGIKIPLDSAAIMDSETYVYNDTVELCISAIKNCEIINVIGNGKENNYKQI